MTKMEINEWCYIRKKNENLRNRTNVKLVNNEKNYLKCTPKPSYMSHKIFNNNLVAIGKSKIALKLYEPTYIGMRMLDSSKVIMHEFYYDHIKNKYGKKSKLLFTDTDTLMCEIKTDKAYENFNSDEVIMFDFSSYPIKSKYYNDSNKLVIGKMNDRTGGVAIEEFVELKHKMYSFLVENSEHKKRKGVNRNAVATISHN